MLFLVASFVLYHKLPDANESVPRSAMSNWQCKRERLSSSSSEYWRYDCSCYALPILKYVCVPLHSYADTRIECDRRPIHKTHQIHAQQMMALVDHLCPNHGVCCSIHCQTMYFASNCYCVSLKCWLADLRWSLIDCANEMIVLTVPVMMMSSLNIF